MPYESVTVDLQDKPAHFLKAYSKANPLPGARAKVPVLDVNGGESVLCESLVVAEYVAELQASISSDTSSSLLLPQRPEDRAVMRLFTELCSSSFSYFPILRAREESKLDDAVETLKSGLKDVDAFLNKMGSDGGPFLFGNQFTLAECSVAPFVQRACVILPSGLGSGRSINPMELCDICDLPRLKAWMKAVIDRPSVVTTGVPRDEMISNMEKMLKRFEAMEKEQAKQ